MAYSQGGLIDAVDYNNFLNGSNQLNTVWGTGSGDAGYGQTALNTVSSAGTVTATQWATLINTLNSARTHQSGSGSGISATTAGSTINYLSTLSTQINSAYTNRLSFATQGTTTTGSNSGDNINQGNGAGPYTLSFTRTATFASAAQMRYFFNCGGQINFVISSASNNDSTSRSGDMVTLAATNLNGFSALRANSGGGRTGSGGTLNTNATNIGFYQGTTSNQTLVSITSTTGSYTSDTAILYMRLNATPGSSTIMYFQCDITSAAKSSPQFNQSVNVTANNRLDIVYPETTNLSNSWGTVTVA